MLFGVSCISSSFCEAVGQRQAIVKRSEVEEAFEETWNGTAWAVASSSGNPAMSILTSVSCVSISFCMAVGYQGFQPLENLGEIWNGSTWSVVTVPDDGNLSNLLNSVSCVATDFCLSGGAYYYNASASEGLLEEWTGSAWTIDAASIGAEAYAVSCASATACTVLTETSPSDRKVWAETWYWNGSSWFYVIVPGPNGGASGLGSVACVPSVPCLAVGEYGRFDTPASWNGSWTKVPAGASLKKTVGLLDVSCISASFCMTVGDYDQVSNPDARDHTVSAMWNGNSWKVFPTPD